MHHLVAMTLGVVMAQGQEGPAQKWTISQGQTLVWDGQPYVPYGLRIPGTPDAIAKAKAAGATDVMVELPANGSGWKDAFEALERAQLKYVIAISSGAPAATGFAVDPQANRIVGIVTPRKFDLPMPGTTSTLSVLVVRRDSAVVRVERTPAINGRIGFEAKVNSGLEHALLLFPETRSLEQIDFWEEFDAHRDQILAAFRRNPPGPGLRGIVNPLGRTVSLPGRESLFVPSSPLFRFEFANLLEGRYKNLETAMRSWSMSTANITSFEHLARFVPLWAGQRGLGQLWDPRTNQLMRVEIRRSAIWTDLNDALALTTARRTLALVRALRTQTGVPVVQEWAGWSPLTESGAPFDGLGLSLGPVRGFALLEDAGRGASSLVRWGRPGWALASEIAPLAGDQPDWAGRLDDLIGLGYRGYYLRSDQPAQIQAFLAESERVRNDAIASEAIAPPIFFPENALNPATIQRLPGGRWWLPSPVDGNRLDLGSQFKGYRIVDASGQRFALWGTAGPQRIRLRVRSANGMSFEALDGSDPNPRVVRGGVEVTISEVPLIISGSSEIPIPDPAYRETVAQFDAILAEAERLKRDLTEERSFFKDAIDTFEQNPGGSLPQLREQLRRAGAKMADYVWIEAESAREHSFSEVETRSGCSSGFALSLRTPLVVDTVPYFANFTVPVRTSQDQEVWIAARIPREARAGFKLTIGSQTMTIQGEPVSFYANGFGWYRLGVTRLAGTTSRLRVEHAPEQGLNLSIDAILLTPRPFRPNGPVRPDPIDFSVAPSKAP